MCLTVLYIFLFLLLNENRSHTVNKLSNLLVIYKWSTLLGNVPRLFVPAVNPQWQTVDLGHRVTLQTIGSFQIISHHRDLQQTGGTLQTWPQSGLLWPGHTPTHTHFDTWPWRNALLWKWAISMPYCRNSFITHDIVNQGGRKHQDIYSHLEFNDRFHRQILETSGKYVYPLFITV